MGLTRSSLALGCALIATTSAHANPIEVFGLTSRRAGQANVGVASADDASALYYDPAGLVAKPGGELMLGTIGAYAHLAIGPARARLSDPLGFQLAVRVPLPLGGALADRFAIGIGMHLLPRNVARIIAPAPDEPFYPYYGDRLSRIVVLPGAAARLGGGFSIGAAVNVLAGLTGTIYAAEGATRALDARIDQRAHSVARAIAGVGWDVSPALRLGAVFRQRFELPFATTAQTVIAGEPLDLDLRASGQFTPHQIAAGVRWSTGEIDASLDIGWQNWAGYPGPYVRVDSRLPLVGAVPGQTPRVPFENTFSVRAGVETAGDDGLGFRGGYGFESSPVPEAQTGVTNLLDGPKHTVAGGVGYVWPKAAGGKPLRIDAHVQLQIVANRKSEKTVYSGTGPYDPFTSLRDEDTNTAGMQISNPGYPGLKSGGEVLSGGLTLEVGL